LCAGLSVWAGSMMQRATGNQLDLMALRTPEYWTCDMYLLDLCGSQIQKRDFRNLRPSRLGLTRTFPANRRLPCLCRLAAIAPNSIAWACSVLRGLAEERRCRKPTTCGGPVRARCQWHGVAFPGGRIPKQGDDPDREVRAFPSGTFTGPDGSD
jgi:hypothetical protein